MNKKTIFIIVGIVIALGVAWYLISPIFIVIEMNEEIPTALDQENESIETIIGLQGDFIPSAHSVAGVAKVIEVNGEKILRFENFDTVNGPNLHIYLATDTGVDDYIDLGGIRATKGNVNYDLPEGIDLETYNTVVVWCVPFRVLFSYAELN